MQKTERARPIRRLAACAALLGLLSGCGDEFLGATDDGEKLSGERISVLTLQRDHVADADIADLEVVLPAARENADWPQPGGNAAHRPGHPALGTISDEVWSARIGSGTDSHTALLASPVASGGRIHTLDTEGALRAFDAATGDDIWRVETASEDEDAQVYGGGITTGDGLVFVGTGHGAVAAFAAESGEPRWQTNVPGPVRSAPTYADGRLFVTTIDNQVVALSASSGERLWTHSGIAENAALLGRASPAVAGDVVIVPYSSGEIFALKAETGRVFWDDNLALASTADAVSSMGDVRGNPVIDDDLVIAISHSGKIAASDLKTGDRVWERQISGANMPWVAGDFVYVVSNSTELFCLTRREGRVRWVSKLPEFDDPEDRLGPIQYVGPVLAGGTLFLASSLGELYQVSPETGETIKTIDFGSAIFIPPIVAAGTLYILHDGGRLRALR